MIALVLLIGGALFMVVDVQFGPRAVMWIALALFAVAFFDGILDALQAAKDRRIAYQRWQHCLVCFYRTGRTVLVHSGDHLE